LWPFLFLYTGHSTREGLISAYTYKRYYKRQPDAEEMPENVCNEDPVTWKHFGTEIMDDPCEDEQ